jgi:acetoin utilization deacetylase AcuC-like enzyme
MLLGRREFVKRTLGVLAMTANPHSKSEPNQTNVKTLPTGIVYDPLYKGHLTAPGHPECPARCDAIIKTLSGPGFRDKVKFLKPRLATTEEILACHTKDYFSTAQRDIEAGRSMLTTGDTQICPKSFEIALYAAGGVLTAVEAVFDKEIKNAFCVVRPPGHHATAKTGMGFCIFNNIAIAARFAQSKYKIKRVLIADWDVHHGNGTQNIFYEDPSVFFFSTHLYPHYPGTGSEGETGSGEGRGTVLNCPLHHGAGRSEIVGAFREKLIPAADKFKPDLVLISAGFDSRAGDPLGGFTLSDRDFAELTSIMLDIAEKHADGRLISVLEGGYAPSGLASASAAHVKTLALGTVPD